MRELVLDGVRRPRNNQPLVLESSTTQTASVAALPTLPRSGLMDGLRPIRSALAAPQPAAATIEELDAIATANPLAQAAQRVKPVALAGVATLPMLAVAGLLGSQTLALQHQSVQAAAPAVAAPVTLAAPTPAPSPVPVAAAAPTGLQQMLDNLAISNTYSLYVKDLRSGQLAVVGPDRVFRSASFYKLFVAQEIYRRIDNGTLTLNQASGSGTGNTIAGCLNLMITISDNGCGNALGSLIGWNNLTQLLRAQGYTGTNLNQPMVTTPRDVAKLFERLYSGHLLSTGSTNAFMSLLKAQKVNNRLPQGLPAGTSFAHKTGDLYGFMHDGGIVFGPKTDYLVVMMGAPGATPSEFATVSQKLYHFFNQ